MDCPYLFPATRIVNANTTCFAAFATAKKRFDAQLQGVQPYRLHDLRRSYSSVMASLGVQQIVVEKLLNHTSGGTQSPISQVYNKYSYLSEMREAILKYEAYLAKLTSPKALST